MFGNLRFITSFDNFLLPNQIYFSVHCFYHFSTSNVLILRCKNTLISYGEVSVKFKLGNLMENSFFKISFLNDQNTLEM